MIRAYMDRQKLSPGRLADMVGVARPTIINLLSGAYPPSNLTLVLLRRVHGLKGLQPEHFTNGASE